MSKSGADPGFNFKVDLNESLTNLRDELALTNPLAVTDVNSKMLIIFTAFGTK